jgi:hypothetical protein
MAYTVTTNLSFGMANVHVNVTTPQAISPNGTCRYGPNLRGLKPQVRPSTDRVYKAPGGESRSVPPWHHILLSHMTTALSLRNIQLEARATRPRADGRLAIVCLIKAIQTGSVFGWYSVNAYNSWYMGGGSY